MLNTLGIDIGLVNFSFCVLRCDEEDAQHVLEWQRVNLLDLCGYPEGFSCKKLTPVDLHNIAEIALPQLFDPTSFLGRYTVQHVAIEQQPHGKYGQIKMIASSAATTKSTISRLHTPATMLRIKRSCPGTSITPMGVPSL